MSSPSSHVPSKLYPLTEAAHLLGSPPSTLRKWIFQRRIAVCRLGRAVRIPEAEILRIQREGLQPRSGGVRA